MNFETIYQSKGGAASVGWLQKTNISVARVSNYFSELASQITSAVRYTPITLFGLRLTKGLDSPSRGWSSARQAALSAVLSRWFDLCVRLETKRPTTRNAGAKSPSLISFSLSAVKLLATSTLQPPSRTRDPSKSVILFLLLSCRWHAVGYRPPDGRRQYFSLGRRPPGPAAAPAGRRQVAGRRHRTLSLVTLSLAAG